MLTQLLLGWTALLSGVQHAAPSVTTKLLSDRGGSRSPTRKCQAFIPPPLPPPLFPTIKQKAELMVDLTEHITGPKGETGCRGPRGRKGKPGVTGPEGEPGSQGVLGQAGQMGDKGERGWRGLYGDIGTPGMMKGEKGRRGFRGEQGLKGRRGLSGEMRERGLAGRPGEKGDPGQWGDPGQRGEQGPRGPTGVRGSLGLKGAQGPTGKQGHPGPAGLHGLTGDPGLPGQVLILPGLQGDEGDGGPSAKCNCSKVQTPKPQKGRVNTIFIANGERQMRRLRGENVMVLRTDRNSLYIYSDSQWINVLVNTAAETYKHISLPLLVEV
uniref:Acetylcholinesterase collagenic tail peptide-like n=1 Tax=Labrus bergylta TaxID=56723 RepID=A0A3Q3GJA8_9LABR